ncbi:hypothetical protein [Candidatus Methanoperedens nitratireducens]|nr:hypothetical protein [Candidatus Methanoperedens nitroreducens]
MNRPDSDIDIFTAFIVPSRDILSGRNHGGVSHCSGNTINRVLLFGINLLNGNGYEFKPVTNQTPDDVKALLEEFDKSTATSKLPEKTNPEPFREYLLDLRMRELNETL